MRFLLVHSPAVGPRTWEATADALRAAGEHVTVPNLTHASLTGDPHAIVAACVPSAADDDVVLVGHSGAGPLLPLIAAERGTQPHLTVFVDAGLPVREGSQALGGDFVPTLRGLATHGVLPPWSRWFGTDILPSLIPDERRRSIIEAELPSLPMELYEAAIELPIDWSLRANAYLLLSDAYADDARAAQTMGWLVAESRGNHLDIAVRGEAIATVLVDMAGHPAR